MKAEIDVYNKDMVTHYLVVARISCLSCRGWTFDMESDEDVVC
jgi:hypothetical protein